MAGSRALATRCPACGTVFRVVPDQLRVSEGWVRCGRCAKVFNAPETLVDMDTGARHSLAGAGHPAVLAAADSAARRELDFTTAPPAPERAVEPAATSAMEPAVGPCSAPGLEYTAEPATEPATEPAAEPATEPVAQVPPLPDPRAEPDDRPAPSFVRRADQAARWRRPRVRLALGAGAGLAALALAAQVVFSYRDLAAARWPALQPVLAQACATLRCEVGPPRFIAGLAVQSSGLSRVQTSDLYRLAVTLRNQADIDLAVPAIDLSLTDTQGRLVSRRVLYAGDLGPVQERLGAGRELVLLATLQVAGTPASEPVAGYTIELFYP